MNDQKLSADPMSLVLGIISIVTVLIGCCCGFLVFPALIIAIIGLVMANKSLKEYREQPENYDRTSFNNVTAARIVNIISVVITSLASLFYLAYFIFYGAVLSNILMNDFGSFPSEDDYEYEAYDDELNTWEEEYDDDLNIWEEEKEVYQGEEDTLVIDTIPVIN